MNKKVFIFTAVIFFSLFFIGCTPPITNNKETTNIEITLANESKATASLALSVDGQAASVELPSASQMGGYNGKEYTTKIVPITNQQFVLNIEEKNTNTKFKQTFNANTGKFIHLTFWGDKFLAEQSQQKLQRID